MVYACIICGNEYKAKPSEGKRYCSVKCYGISQRKPVSERFWNYVEKTDGCWLWKGQTDGHGYGVITAGMGSTKPLQAHRVSWEIENGPIPEDMEICHDCDKYYPKGSTAYKRCVNPSHLFAGTHLDNMRDMVNKQRTYDRSGERNPKAKLTVVQVAEIRQLFADKEMSQGQLGKKYGVRQQHISLIVRGISWAN